MTAKGASGASPVANTDWAAGGKSRPQRPMVSVG